MKKKQLKLERLEGSKFEAFKENQLLSTMNVFGGKLYNTYHNSKTINDCWDDGTGSDIHCVGGYNYDRCQTQ